MVVGVRFRDYLATVNKKRSNTIPACVDTEVGKELGQPLPAVGRRSALAARSSADSGRFRLETSVRGPGSEKRLAPLSFASLANP